MKVPIRAFTFKIKDTMLNAYDKFVSVLNVKELVSTFNQEKAQAGAFSVIVKSLGSFVLSSIAPPGVALTNTTKLNWD